MSKLINNLTEVDVGKLFVEHKIDEIVEIEKLLDAEIERKRTELRSMVGDRYKDILTASDSIKSMKNISTRIVESIQNICVSCDTVLENSDFTKRSSLIQSDRKKNDERILVIQIMLAIYTNEAIWTYLDKEDYLNASQLYLLGQNIHTGLNFINSSIIHRVPLLKHVKHNLTTLRNIILDRIIRKLESVELTAEQTCSNLNGLWLLQNQNTDQLISIFMDHRKTALSTVINISHPSVRVQISAMVKCLVTTIHLLYDCFMCSGGTKSGLIFRQLEEILRADSDPILSKLKIPTTPLEVYIPQIVREFRPKCKIPSQDAQTYSKEKLIEKWLEETKETVKLGLCKSLELVKNIKGLYIIREEALKIVLPTNWEIICEAVNLPKNFNVWQYFFQNLITERAKALVTTKVKNNMDAFRKDIDENLKMSSKSSMSELDLRSYVWTEDPKDVGRLNELHTGLSMKSLGFSQTIVGLCERLDEKFLELLRDLFQYLYGVEFEGNIPFLVRNSTYEKKMADVIVVQECLVQECFSMNVKLLEVVMQVLKEDISEETVEKTIFYIRLLQAITKLCPYFKKCCSMNNRMEDWYKICDDFNKCSTKLWKNWIDYVVRKMTQSCSENFKDLECRTTLSMFLRWDSIEIQEQTDDKVFKSHIKVPLKPSAALIDVLVKLNENLCCVIPHTLPKDIHVECIEKNVEAILNLYNELLKNDCNQNHALQLLFDVKLLTVFCIKRENERLINISQDICDKLRSKIDPFDLDVFYPYLQANVKRAAIQSQVILGCLLPSFMQLANLEVSEKRKDQEREEASTLAVSNPSSNSWFPLLPITAPSHKQFGTPPNIEEKEPLGKQPSRNLPKKPLEGGSFVKSNTASLFGGLTTDWFS